MQPHKQRKRAKRTREKPKKGETGCVLGAGEDENGWGTGKTGWENPESEEEIRDGLVWAAASVGSRQSATSARSPHDTHCAGRSHASLPSPYAR